MESIKRDANFEKVSDAFQNNNNVEWIKFPFEIRDVEEKVNRELLDDFTGERAGFVQVGPKNYLFPSGYRQNAEMYYNFQPRTTDIWIVTFPRSGTTWTQELVWLLTNNLDYQTAMEIPLDARFPFLEFDSFCHPEVVAEFLQENENDIEKCEIIREVTSPAWKFFTQTTERRFIKTHLPFHLLPPNLLKIGCKVIYVARNPKDVAVSFYHLNHLFRTQGYLRDFPKFWYYFKNGLLPWTPYWAHIQEGWDRRHEENLFFMFYEDMNINLKKCIDKVANFLRVRYTSEQYDELIDHLKFENFKNNKSVNLSLLKDLGIIRSNVEGFVRKGKTGGWKDYFNEELNEETDKWIEENSKKIGIKFPNF